MYSVPFCLFFKNPYYMYLTNPCVSNLSPSVAIVLHPTAILILSSPGLASWDLAHVVALDSALTRAPASFMLLHFWNSYFLNKQLCVFILHWVSQIIEPVLFLSCLDSRCLPHEQTTYPLQFILHLVPGSPPALTFCPVWTPSSSRSGSGSMLWTTTPPLTPC